MSLKLHLSNIDQVLGIAGTAIPPECISAFNYTLLWSQLIAQKDSNNPSSQAFFEKMRNELSKVGWLLDEASKVSYSGQTGSSVSPISIIKSIFNSLPIDDVSHNWVNQFLSRIQMNNIQDDESELLKFWWSKSQTQNLTNLLISPIQFDRNKGISTTIVRFVFNFAGEDWKSLFISHSSEQLFVDCCYFKMVLNLGIWNAIKDELELKLVGSASKYIQELDLNL